MLSHTYQSVEDNTKVVITLEDGKSTTFSCSIGEYVEGLHALEQGAMIQDAFPFLTPGEREFLLTGITDEEWKRFFGEEEW